MKLGSLDSTTSGYVHVGTRKIGSREVIRYCLINPSDSSKVFGASEGIRYRDMKPEDREPILERAVQTIAQLLLDNPELVPLFEKDKVIEQIRSRKYLVINGTAVCFTKRAATSSSQPVHVDKYFSDARLSFPVRCSSERHFLEKEYAEFWRDSGRGCPGPGCGMSHPLPDDFSVDEEKVDDLKRDRESHRLVPELKDKIVKLVKVNGELVKVNGAYKERIQTLTSGIMALSSKEQAVTSLQSSVRGLPAIEGVIVDIDSSRSSEIDGVAVDIPQSKSRKKDDEPKASPRAPKALKLGKGDKVRLAFTMIKGKQRDASLLTAYQLLGLDKDMNKLTKKDIQAAYDARYEEFATNPTLRESLKHAKDFMDGLVKKK